MSAPTYQPQDVVPIEEVARRLHVEMTWGPQKSPPSLPESHAVLQPRRPRGEEAGRCGVTTALTPVQKYMLRLVLFGAGKTVLHKGTICEVLETHSQIRRLLPLIKLDLSELKEDIGESKSFWAPRPRERKEIRNERIYRQYVSGIRVVFPTPHWTGEPRPALESVLLAESNVLNIEDAQRLVHELGYDANAAFTSFSRSKMNTKPDRRRLGVIKTEGGKWLDRTKIAQPIPYVAAAPARRTKTGGGFTKDSVLQAVARMRTSHQMRMAVFEVVFRRRFPSQIADEYGVGVRALNKAASRVRKTIRADAQQPCKNAASEGLMGIPCT